MHLVGTESLKWLQDDLEQLQSMAPKGCVKLSFHVTGAAGLSMDDEKKTIATAGRADIGTLVQESTHQHKTLGIAGETWPPWFAFVSLG